MSATTPKLFLFLAITNLLLVKGDPIRVMTASYPPLVQCNNGTVSNSASDFSGIEINNVRAIMALAGFNQSQWVFECINFEDWQVKVQSTSEYLAFAGALAIDYGPVTNPYQVLFSYSYWNTGATILTYQGINEWQFINVLTVRIAALIAGMCIISGILYFFFERRKNSLEKYLWNSFTNVYFMPTISLTRLPSRLVQIGVWFVILIVLMNFIGQITAQNTLTLFEDEISSFYSLTGMRVKTLSAYTYRLIEIGAKPVSTYFGLPNEYTSLGPDVITAEMVINDLTRNDQYRVDAFVIDDTFANILSYIDCYIFLSKRLFYTVPYGFAFSVLQNQTIMRSIDVAIYQYLFYNSADNNLAQYNSANFPTCVKDPTQVDVNSTHVVALFIVQGVVAAAALVLWIFTKLPIYIKIRQIGIEYGIFSKYPEVLTPIYKKVGDDVSAENLKEVTQKLHYYLSIDVSSRLDEMEETVMLFFDKLLSEEHVRRQKRIYKHVGDIDSFIERHDKSGSEYREYVSKEQIHDANSIDHGTMPRLGHLNYYVYEEDEEEQPSEDLLRNFGTENRELAPYFDEQEDNNNNNNNNNNNDDDDDKESSVREDNEAVVVREGVESLMQLEESSFMMPEDEYQQKEPNTYKNAQNFAYNLIDLKSESEVGSVPATGRGQGERFYYYQKRQQEYYKEEQEDSVLGIKHSNKSERKFLRQQDQDAPEHYEEQYQPKYVHFNDYNDNADEQNSDFIMIESFGLRPDNNEQQPNSERGP